MLCLPTLVGPVSELLGSVRVTSGLPGAEIIVSSIGAHPRDVAKGIAKGGNDRIQLIPGQSLRADDLLVVRQSSNGVTSSVTPHTMALGVQPAPKNQSDIGAVGFRSHLYTCGQHVWVVGAIPGATVRIEFGGSAPAVGLALENGARLALASGLRTGVPARISQSTQVGSGPILAVLPDPAPAPGGVAPAPVIQQPVMGCQTAVLVSGVIDGATVTLKHASGAVETGGFDAPALWFGLAPLKEHDALIPRQELRGCEISSADGTKATVASANPPTPIVIPPCAGSTLVHVGGLVPGATVRIHVNSIEHVGMAPPDSPTYSFMVEPLPPAGTVSVTQELCGVKSPATTVPISIHEDVTTPVKVVEPLLGCARAVSVTNAHDGARLQVFARDHDTHLEAPISDFFTVHGTQATIPVAPLLVEGDEVVVRQWACSMQPTTSTPVSKVQAHSAPAPPKLLEPVLPGPVAVVVDALPGALVEVFVIAGETPEFAGAAIANPGPTTVGLNRELATREQVRARQTVCEQCTALGPVASVARPLPQPPVLDEPAVAATGVDRRPTFRWHDPQPTGDGKADGFYFTLHEQGVASVVDEKGPATSWRPAADLKPRATYIWTVVGFNATGEGQVVTRSFTTGTGPLPRLDGYDLTTRTLTGQGFTPGANVSVRLAMFGSLAATPYGWTTDTRDQRIPTKADANGKIKIVIDPNTALPWLEIPYTDHYITGVITGETMHFSATDGRLDPHNLTGFLWSNTLAILVP